MAGSIFSLSFFVSLIASTIRLATPILIPALGQIYTQRAGILNLGVEGTMLMGSIAAFSTAAATGSLWLGILAGILAGINAARRIEGKAPVLFPQTTMLGALSRYIALSRAGGTRPFGELLEAAGIPSPFEEGSLSALGAECVRIADELEKKL